MIGSQDYSNNLIYMGIVDKNITVLVSNNFNQRAGALYSLYISDGRLMDTTATIDCELNYGIIGAYTSYQVLLYIY